MLDDPAQFRLRAEACRRLAELADDPQRESIWLERANDWDQLAAKAEKKLRAKIKSRI
jgi:hypothetical protein